MRRRRKPDVTEFVVEVGADRIQWNGLDAFLVWLLNRKPEGGFSRHARTINWFGPRSRRPRRSK